MTVCCPSVLVGRVEKTQAAQFTVPEEGVYLPSIRVCGSITHHVESHQRAFSKKGNYSFILSGGLKIIIIIIIFTDVILL